LNKFKRASERGGNQTVGGPSTAIIINTVLEYTNKNPVRFTFYEKQKCGGVLWSKKIQTVSDMTAEIDLHDNAVYVVAGGQIIQVDSPPSGYGKEEISWYKGEPTH